MAERMLERVTGLGADYADLRWEKVVGNSIDLRDGEIREVISSSDSGVGMRVLVEGGWGFVSTNDIDPRSLIDMVERGFRLARTWSRTGGEREELAPVEPSVADIQWRPEKDPRDVALEDKIVLVKDIDARAREVDSVVAVTVSLSDGLLEHGFYSSEGSSIRHRRTTVNLSANIIAREGPRTGSMRMRIAGRKGMEIFEESDPLDKASEYAGRADALLEGKRPPSGRLPLVADPDLAGVFAHEALGHACEADAIMGRDSILEGRLGDRIASDHVDVYDDPTLEGAFGSFEFDDEGVKGRRKALVREGVLREFIHTRTTASKLGQEPNGGGRAEAYYARPLVRMSNTFIGAGDHKFEELLEDIDRGVYAKGSRGGQVDTAKGTFQFNAQEAFLVEKGEITVPLRDVSFSGHTLQILEDITALGDDMRVGDPGYCGKGQWVPVGDGGPHILVSSASLGGG